VSRTTLDGHSWLRIDRNQGGRHLAGFHNRTVTVSHGTYQVSRKPGAVQPELSRAAKRRRLE
jgi:hypothetical protein